MLLCRMVLAWTGASYHAFTRNCCTFCDELCQGLGVGPLPPWINNLATTFAPVATAGAAVSEQAGKLADRASGPSKDEMMAAIRYGADEVFKPGGAEVTDDDIDAIMSAGEERTAALSSKLSKLDSGDLLDFKLDGGINTQEFEGVDYAKARKEAEEQKRRAEQDKLAAITALEARSREFMKEKQDKLKLEERIKQLEGQLLIGGRKLGIRQPSGAWSPPSTCASGRTTSGD